MNDNTLGFQWIFRLGRLYWDEDRKIPSEASLHLLICFVSQRFQTYRLKRWDAQSGSRHYKHTVTGLFYVFQITMFWRQKTLHKCISFPLAWWGSIIPSAKHANPFGWLVAYLGPRTKNCWFFCLLIQLDTIRKLKCWTDMTRRFGRIKKWKVHQSTSQNKAHLGFYIGNS